MRRGAAFAGTLAALATLAGDCDVAVLVNAPGLFVAINIDPDSVTVPVGDTVRLEGLARDTLGRDRRADLIWSTENPAVATVTNGLGTGTDVVGRSPGTTRVLARVPGGGPADSVGVRVTGGDAAGEPAKAALAGATRLPPPPGSPGARDSPPPDG